MSGIFVCYRRVDTSKWAGHLFERLIARFGQEVFMDNKGGIQPGHDYYQTLHSELLNCEVLLALVGPAWLNCTRTVGTEERRRLDWPDDWVRTEIATALQRRILVIPVLLDGAGMPDVAQLPDVLHEFAQLQGEEIREKDLDHDFNKLATAIMEKIEPLGGYWPIELPNLLDIINGSPFVHTEMDKSDEMAAATRKQVETLELYKGVHDELHHIEIEIQAQIELFPRPSHKRLSSLATQFKRHESDIIAQSNGHELLRGDELFEALSATVEEFKHADDAFRHAGDTEEAYGRLCNELNRLNTFSVSLAQQMSAIETSMRSHDLAKQMQKFIDMIEKDKRIRNAIKMFDRDVQTLKDKQKELERLIRQHDAFQALDLELRPLCKGGGTGLTKAQWERVKKCRKKLGEPLPSSWRKNSKEMEQTEKAIEDSLGNGTDKDNIMEYVEKYSQDLVTIFFDLDSEVKRFIGVLKSCREFKPFLSRGREGGDI